MLKKLIFLLIVLMSCAGFYIFFPRQAHGLLYYSSCNKPFRYTIGEIDERFHITKEDLKTHISEAGQIWSNAYGKPLFTYDPSSKFTVNLIYDERQSLNSQITDLQKELNTNRKSIDPKIAEYDTRSAAFKKRLASLNAEIEMWNRQGGAPVEVYQRLQKEQKALEDEATALNAMAKELNQTTQVFNAQVKEFDETVETYNSTLEVRPEEGLFNPAENRIDVYFYVTKDELVHTLAHELGHALGLKHNSNTVSIMYEKTNDQVTPSGEDLAELHAVCQERNVFMVAQERLVFLWSHYTKMKKVSQ